MNIEGSWSIWEAGYHNEATSMSYLRRPFWCLFQSGVRNSNRWLLVPLV